MKLRSVHKINVAIDGPAGAGKSTVARKVAEALGYVYVDTGAMYRSVTLKAIRFGIAADDAAALARLAEQSDIRLVPGPSGQRVLLDGEDVTDAIRSPEVTDRVVHVSALPDVRAALVRLQRAIARERGVVMDGRDIGTNVLPDAEVKVFMTASLRVRAERRWQELKEKRPDVTVEQLMRQLEERDRLDSGRAVSPLRRAEDAVELDTTEMTVEQAVEAIVRLCRAALGES